MKALSLGLDHLVIFPLKEIKRHSCKILFTQLLVYKHFYIIYYINMMFDPTLLTFRFEN